MRPEDSWYPEAFQAVAGKVTGKLQVTIPKALAERLGLAAGDGIVWELVGGSLRVRPEREMVGRLGADERLALWSASRERQRVRDRARGVVAPGMDRGWTREELYRRGDLA